MSNPLDSLFAPLRDAPPPAPFAPAARVRRRGRQRSRRVAATALAAVLATGVGSVAAVRQLDGAPGVRPHQGASASPTPAARPTGGTGPVPAAALLTAADVGPGVTVEAVDDLGPDGPDWPWELSGCPEYRRADYPSHARRGPARVQAYARGGGVVATQTVERYAPGAGPGNLDDIRRVLTACAAYPVLGPPIYEEDTGMRHRFQVLDSDLAGDESLLVRETRTPVAGQPPTPDGPATVTHHVVVRRGDLVTTITLYDGSEALARQLAPLAARRL